MIDARLGPHARAGHKMKANLIYDVGMHKGEDTDYYLRKGLM